MAYGKREREQRRVGRDLKRLPQDINVYRWFAVYVKCLKELEGQTFKIRGKNYKLGFSSHKWWSMINPKHIPKSPKFIRESNVNLPRDIDRFFNGQFWLSHRDKFIEKTTIFPEANNSEIPPNFNSFHFPPDYPRNNMIADIKEWYKQTERRPNLKVGRTAKGKSKSNADIILDNSFEEILKRLFHTLRIELTHPDLTNLDIFFKVNKIMNKKFVIPKIERINSKTTYGKGTRTTRQEWMYEIRKTQRDRRFAKILLINLSKGVFPKIDRLI